MLNWNVIHEMDDESGKPTCWGCELSNIEAIEEYGRFLWISKYAERKYYVECKQNGNIVKLKGFSSFKQAKNYANIFS